jgi:hypothetical protein
MIEKFSGLSPENKYALMLGSIKVFEFTVKDASEDLFMVQSGKTIDLYGQRMFDDEKYTIKDLGCFKTDSYSASVKTAAYTERSAAERINEKIVIPAGFLKKLETDKSIEGNLSDV